MLRILATQCLMVGVISARPNQNGAGFKMLISKKNKMEASIKFRVRALVFVSAALLVVGTLGFMLTENLSPLDAFYFCIVTITTVGYGDISPATAGGKVLAVVLIVMGVGTFLGIVAGATEMFLSRRDRQVRLQKLHLVIGLFFSEIGTKLLESFSTADRGLDAVRGSLLVSGEWAERDFASALEKLSDYDCDLDGGKTEPEFLRVFLRDRSDLLMRLLENPYLLEHESFTDLLHAVFHLREELIQREHIEDSPQSDREHLLGDMRRVYLLLIPEWVRYMRHLKDNYPYLFSLAARMNPFDADASIIVE
jgi:hypothetical protein